MGVSLQTMDDGCRIAYWLSGPQDAPLIVFSHALGANHEMWQPQVDSFSERYRVLCYDTRGHGASDAPVGAYSLDRLGRDVLELLDGVGGERAFFCGLSLGGMTGQWLGVRAPERFEGLVLANTALYAGPPSNWRSRIDSVRSAGMQAVTEGVLEKWFTPGFRSRRPEAVEAVRRMLLNTRPEGYAGACAAIRDMDLRVSAPLFQRPALVIGGRADPSTPPALQEALASALASKPALVWLESAHLSNIEQAEAFNHSVLDFIS